MDGNVLTYTPPSGFAGDVVVHYTAMGGDHKPVQKELRVRVQAASNAPGGMVSSVGLVPSAQGIEVDPGVSTRVQLIPDCGDSTAAVSNVRASVGTCQMKGNVLVYTPPGIPARPTAGPRPTPGPGPGYASILNLGSVSEPVYVLTL